MGGRALHREPFDLWEVIALGKEKIFFISLFDKRVSNENISPGARHVNSREKKKKKKKKAWRRIVAVAELPHECSSLNKM